VPQTLSTGIAHEDWVSPATPGARQEFWTNALQELVRRHPRLSEASRKSIDSAAAIASPALFADDPSAALKGEIAFTLKTLQHNLSASQFQEVLTGFHGLLTWLQDMDLVGDPDCDCNETCSKGYTCKSIDCHHKAGTTSNGVCEPDPPLDE